METRNIEVYRDCGNIVEVFGVLPILGAHHTGNVQRSHYFESTSHDWLLAMGAGYYSHTTHIS